MELIQYRMDLSKSVPHLFDRYGSIRFRPAFVDETSIGADPYRTGAASGAVRDGSRLADMTQPGGQFAIGGAARSAKQPGHVFVECSVQRPGLRQGERSVEPVHEQRIDRAHLEFIVTVRGGDARRVGRAPMQSWISVHGTR